jgi:hypothetical protein
MTRYAAIAVYVVAMVVVIFTADFWFRDRMSTRLLVRVAIVLLSAALYLRFFKSK